MKTHICALFILVNFAGWRRGEWIRDFTNHINKKLNQSKTIQKLERINFGPWYQRLTNCCSRCDFSDSILKLNDCVRGIPYIHEWFTNCKHCGTMCQRSEKLMDLSIDPNNDSRRDIVLQTNIVAKQPPANVDANSETNGKRSPAAALSPSSIILSPCDDNEKPNNGTNNTTTATTTTTSTDEEFDEVKQFFDSKLHIIEKWLHDRASPEIQSRLHEATDILPRSPKLRTSSVTSDLFQQWLSSSPVQVCYSFTYRISIFVLSSTQRCINIFLVFLFFFFFAFNIIH